MMPSAGALIRDTIQINGLRVGSVVGVLDMGPGGREYEP